MLDIESKVNKLDTEVAAIKEKVSFFSVIYEKFDRTLDKLDQRTIEDRKEINEMMSLMRNEIMQEIKALREDMASQHEVEKSKIDDLNKWRWIVMGGAAVIGWIFSKVLNVK
jgi:predicted RNase H-like nuclease (RuvC/YqgF family)